MALLSARTIEVEYVGTDERLTRSLVYDSIHIPIPVQGKLAGQPAGLIIQTFFLVAETVERKKLMWISKEKCQIHNIY